jgi:2-polyprenyl-3-methyl-5-hydroxy-6-metoxy-1,4-benzoquinol methylase
MRLSEFEKPVENNFPWSKIEMDKTKQALHAFYEDVGEKYPEEEAVYNTLRGQLRKKFILSHLRQLDGSLLEIGCNRGMYLQAYSGGPCFGVDISLNVLRKAHKKKQMHLLVADAERLQCLKEASFRNVLCSEVLEHCINPQDVFESIKHVLQPKGQALLTTPNYNYKDKKPKWIKLGALAYFGVTIDCENGYFHTAYNPDELADLAKNAGLKIVELGTLEKEIKYAAKIPVLILLTGRFFNKLLHSEKFDKANETFFHLFTLKIYSFCKLTQLDRFFQKFISVGARSYIIFEKS